MILLEDATAAICESHIFNVATMHRKWTQNCPTMLTPTDLAKTELGGGRGLSFCSGLDCEMKKNNSVVIIPEAVI